MGERIRKLFTVTPFKITVLVILIALTLFFVDVRFIKFMELKALDLRMVSRGELPSGGETVIVTVDEKSLNELGRWPWPRTTVAKVVERLKAGGAKAVGFDVVFAEPDENSSLKTLASLGSEMKRLGIHDRQLSSLIGRKQKGADTDAALAQAIARARNVTLGYFFHIQKRDAEHMTERQISEGEKYIRNSRYATVKMTPESNDSPIVPAYAAVTNLKAISAAGQNSGYFNAFPDSDGTIRWSPLVIKFRDGYYTSLALSTLMQYLDGPMLTLNLAEFGVESIRLGSIEIPTDESGRLLLNYLGPAKTFPHHSAADVYANRLPAGTFKDKIVLIGATATGIYDLRVTPFSAVYPGVEIHATAIDNILHQRFLIHSAWTMFIDICAIILCGLLIGMAAPRLKAVQGVLLILAALTVFVVFNAVIFSRLNIWLNLIYPVLTMMTIYLGITVYRYVTEEREKKKIRGAFQYYLTASVITEMLKDPDKLKLGGDKKDLSVLFSDIRGFTTVSEKLSPEELVHLLNEYLTAMTNIVFKYEGLLDKYMGDAIMAVFGAPLDQPDHALRACRTALGMMEALKTLQKKWTDEGRPVLNIGVGINSGDMVVGNMGSEMRFDYTVMGDSVNLGSRLEGINKEYGTNIVISEYTYAAVKEKLCCRELDMVRVKGKKLPVRIYELLGEKRDEAKWRDLIRLFDEALALYRQGCWDDATAAFRKVLEVRPGDPPSELYLERCVELQKEPPPEDWDGVCTMTRK